MRWAGVMDRDASALSADDPPLFGDAGSLMLIRETCQLVRDDEVVCEASWSRTRRYA
jgi:hypothetical protein